MRRLLAVLMLLVLALPAAELPPTLRVATWNLQWFPGGRMGAPKA
jgi:hypothetical protein